MCRFFTFSFFVPFLPKYIHRRVWAHPPSEILTLRICWCFLFRLSNISPHKKSCLRNCSPPQPPIHSNLCTFASGKAFHPSFFFMQFSVIIIYSDHFFLSCRTVTAQISKYYKWKRPYSSWFNLTIGNSVQLHQNEIDKNPTMTCWKFWIHLNFFSIHSEYLREITKRKICD